jgi:hypothetical protein
LPFGRLWYERVEDAIGYAKFYSRSHATVIQVFDASICAISFLNSFERPTYHGGGRFGSAGRLSAGRLSAARTREIGGKTACFGLGAGFIENANGMV